MGLSVTFHRAANAELIEAIAWYESKRNGLAIGRTHHLASQNMTTEIVGNQSDKRGLPPKFPILSFRPAGEIFCHANNIRTR
jgi:hypothetical protein